MTDEYYLAIKHIQLLHNYLNFKSKLKTAEHKEKKNPYKWWMRISGGQWPLRGRQPFFRIYLKKITKI